MPTTTINALRYPAGTDPAAVHTDMSEIAADLDTRLVPRFANSAARSSAITAPTEGQVAYLSDVDRLEYYDGMSWLGVGARYVGEDTESASAATSTGTEAFSVSVTFTAISAARYKISWSGIHSSTVIGDIARLRLRGEAAGSVTSSGTQLRIITVRAEVASSGAAASMMATVTGVSGTYTVGASVQRVVGTGTYSISGGSTDESYLLVERIY